MHATVELRLSTKIASHCLAGLCLLCVTPLAAQSFAEQTLDSRVQRLENILGTQVLYEQDQRIATLESDNRRLHGELEASAHALEQMGLRLERLLADVEARVYAIETEAALAPEASSDLSYSADEPSSVLVPEVASAVEDAGRDINQAPPTTEIKSEPKAETKAETKAEDSAEAPQLALASASVLSPEDEKNRYLGAFEFMKRGRYADADAAFTELLRSYPDGRFAANAAYWQAEALYVQRDYDAAQKAFLRVIERYSDSLKVPEALYKHGLILRHDGNEDAARQRFEQVVQRHSGSAAARLAQRALEE